MVDAEVYSSDLRVSKVVGVGDTSETEGLTRDGRALATVVPRYSVDVVSSDALEDGEGG